MAWISSRELISLFEASLFLHCDQAHRAAADQTLRSHRQNAINYGDCLVEILQAHDSAFSQVGPQNVGNLKFAAAMQLESLVEADWKDGLQFSDKPRILSALHELGDRFGSSLAATVATPTNATTTSSGDTSCSKSINSSEERLLDSIMQCLARVCVVDSPNNLWEQYIDTAITQAIGHTPAASPISPEAPSAAYGSVATAPSDLKSQRFLSQLALLSGAANVPLWEFLCSDGINRIPLVGGAVTPSGCPLKVSLYEKLLEHQPLGTTQRNRSLIPPTLLGEVVQGMLHVSAHVKQANGVVSDAIVECISSLHLVLRRIGGSTATTEWSAVMQHCLEVLYFLKTPYALRQDAAERAATELLETLQMGYDSHDGHFTAFPALDVFGTLVSFAFDPRDEDEESAMEHLYQDLVDEGSVLTGCASGRSCDVACSIIQLFIRFDQGLLGQVLQGWKTAANEACQRGDARTSAALSKMIVAVAKECEEGGLSLIDITTSPDVDVVGTIQSLLQLQLPPILRARFLLALGSVTKFSKSVDKCGNAFVTALGNADSSHPSLIRTFAVTACGRILASSIEVAGALEGSVPGSLVETVVGVCTEKGATQLAVHGALKTLCTLMDLAPRWNAALWQTGSLLNCVSVALHHAGRADVVQQLSLFIRELLDTHVDHGQCQQFQTVVLGWLGVVQGSPDCTHPTSRALIETAQRIAVCDRCNCRNVVTPIYEYVAFYSKNAGPHDDSCIRALATSLGTSSIFLPTAAISTVMGSALELFKQACARPSGKSSKKRGSATVSITGVFVGLCAIRLRGLVSSQTMAEYLTLANTFSSGCTKDFNLTGVLLGPAATIALSPDMGIEAILSTDSGSVLGFFSLWLSLFPFADRRCQTYSMAAWLQLLSRLAQPGGTVHPLLVAGIQVLHFTSVHVAPTASTATTISQGITTTAASLLAQSSSPPKLSNFSVDEKFSMLDLKRIEPSFAQEDIFSLADRVARWFSGGGSSPNTASPNSGSVGDFSAVTSLSS